MQTRKKNYQRLVKVIVVDGDIKPEEFLTRDDMQENVLRAPFKGAYKYCYDLGVRGKQIVHAYKNLVIGLKKIKDKNKLPDYLEIKDNIAFYKTNEQGEIVANETVLKWEKITQEDVTNRFDELAAKEAIEDTNLRSRQKNKLDDKAGQIEESKNKKQKYDNHSCAVISIANLCAQPESTLFGHQFKNETITFVDAKESDKEPDVSSINSSYNSKSIPSFLLLDEVGMFPSPLGNQPGDELIREALYLRNLKK